MKSISISYYCLDISYVVKFKIMRCHIPGPSHVCAFNDVLQLGFLSSKKTRGWIVLIYDSLSRDARHRKKKDGALVYCRA